VRALKEVEFLEKKYKNCFDLISRKDIHYWYFWPTSKE